MYRSASPKCTDSIPQFHRVLSLHIIFLLLFACLWVAACSDSTGPEQASYPGTWVGFIELGSSSGTLTLEISEDLSCFAIGSVSGTITNWGDYNVDLEGNLTVGVNGRIMGGVSICRVCTMFDTTFATATMTGQFDLNSASVQGTWTTAEDSPFMAGGRWGAVKQ